MLNMRLGPTCIHSGIQDILNEVNRTNLSVLNTLCTGYLTMYIIRTLSSVPRMSGLERFHCIYSSNLWRDVKL